MIADLGLIVLVLAALMAIYAFVMAILGGTQKRPDYIESARRAAVVVMPLLTLACLTIIYSNLTGDYSLEYTYRVSNNTTPTFLRITALWGGQNGSILFWNWLMSLYIFFVFLRPWKSNRDLLPWVIAVSIGTQAFFILLTIFFANPFARLFADAAGNVSAGVFQPAGLRRSLRRRAGAQSAAAPSGHDHPSAHVVSGLRRVGDPLCVCDGGADRQEQDR